jgi:hypothetical protein
VRLQFYLIRSSQPRADIGASQLTFIYRTTSEETAEIKSLFQDDLGRTVQRLKQLEGIAAEFNSSLRKQLETALAGRRQRFARTRAMASEMGFPTQQRDISKPKIVAPAPITNPQPDSEANRRAKIAGSPKSPQRTKLFISYSHNDRKWLDKFLVHLRQLERDGIVDRWDDTRIDPGSRWRDEIKKAIDATKVAVLLVSPEFLASDFIAEDELPPLLQAAKKEGVTVLPVILRPCRFEETKNLSQFQAVNSPSRPLVKMSSANRDALWVQVTNEVEAGLARK